MSDDLNRLLIKIQADTSQLATALRAAESGVAQSSQRIERTIEKNASKFKKWGDSLASQLKGVAAGYLGLEVAGKAVEAVHLVADIEDMAQAAGVTTDKFQELAFAAKAAGASSEDLAKGLDKFNVAMSGVRLNTGGFNDFLKEQAPALRNALAATTSQEQAIRVLADAMQGLGDDSQRASLLQQAFGKSSKELIGVLSEGSRALDDAALKAHQFGGVLDKDMIEKAKQAEAEFAALETVLVSTFERAAVSAAKFGIDVAHALAHPIELLEKMNSMSGAAMGGVGARGRSPMAIASGSSAQPTTSGWDATVTKDPSWSLKAKPDNTGSDKLAALNKQLLDAQGQIGASLRAQYDLELKDWQRMLDNKQISEQQFAQARADLQSIMAQKTKDNLGAETQWQKDYYTQIQGLMNSTFMDSFSSALETGKFKASEFFNSMLQGLAKITMQTLVLKPLIDSLFTPPAGGGFGKGGGGLFGSLLGGLFGGFLAEGGPADSSKPYIVGERGPELFVPNTSGRVKNARETNEIFTPSMGGRSGGSQGTSVSNVYAPVIDARGADIGVIERMHQALRASQRAQQSPVTAQRQAQKRFPTR